MSRSIFFLCQGHSDLFPSGHLSWKSKGNLWDMDFYSHLNMPENDNGLLQK